MRTCTIQFKCKVQKAYNMDDTLAYEYVSVPQLHRHHCDMNAFRQSAKYGAYANSDLFPAILARVRRDVFGEATTIRLDRIPAGVKVDATGFLAQVEFVAPA